MQLLTAVAARSEPVPAKVLAREAGLPLSTAYHLLNTLVHDGYLYRIEDGYVLGEIFGRMTPPDRFQLLLSTARPLLERVRDQLGAAAYLALYQNGEVHVATVVDSPQTPRVVEWADFSATAHATAFGKSILAILDREDRMDYLSRHGLASLTARTITSPSVLMSELDKERRGPFVDQEEYQIGTVCAAKSLSTPGLTAAIAVSTRARRLPEILHSGPALTPAVKKLARTLMLFEEL
jgi:DNA-binding IclR family transcriptional regulator